LPPIGKFPITDDWMPSDDFVGQAAQWGINLGDRPGYTQWNFSSSAITGSAKEGKTPPAVGTDFRLRA
jgi:hypothetical protein